MNPVEGWLDASCNSSNNSNSGSNNNNNKSPKYQKQFSGFQILCRPFDHPNKSSLSRALAMLYVRQAVLVFLFRFFFPSPGQFKAARCLGLCFMEPCWLSALWFVAIYIRGRATGEGGQTHLDLGRVFSSALPELAGLALGMAGVQ